MNKFRRQRCFNILIAAGHEPLISGNATGRRSACRCGCKAGAWRGQGGFTLIEALVAIVIVSIGLLGSAWLQIYSMRTTQNAYLQSQAAVIAADLADRIRANPEGAELGVYDDIDTGELPSDPDCIDEGCSPTQLANHDIREWSAQVTGTSALLPSGSATVSRSGEVYTVTLNWTEQDLRSATEKAVEDQEGTDSTQRSYEVRFSP